MTALTVMTWNLQNFFLSGHDEGPATIAQYSERLTLLAKTIDRVKPDILALQEVGGMQEMCTLQAALYNRLPHTVMGFPDNRGIGVVLLSNTRFDRDSIVHFRPSPEYISPLFPHDNTLDSTTSPHRPTLNDVGRDAIRVTLTIDGKDVTIITAHFKSKLISYKRDPDTCIRERYEAKSEEERYRYAAHAISRRTAEAVAVREQVNQALADPDKPHGGGREKAVIVMGDFNDVANAATTQLIQGPPGYEIETARFGRADKGDGYRLWNIASLLPDIAGEPAYSRIYRGRPELIDHIFASRVLVDPDRMPIADTIANPSPLPVIEDDPSAQRNKASSDHAAVFATFYF